MCRTSCSERPRLLQIASITFFPPEWTTQWSTSATDEELVAAAFLLSHFREESDYVMGRLVSSFQRDHPTVDDLVAVFNLWEHHPGRAHFFSTYLGSEACARVGPDQLRLCQGALACPVCHGELHFGEDEIRCDDCDQSFGWLNGIPSLVVPEFAPADEFPAGLVELYETKSRPRFVRSMAGDWHGAIDRSREASYIDRFLVPVNGAVADLACGTGLWSQLVVNAVGPSRVVAMDFSLAMLEVCQRTYPRLIHLHGDAGRLPFGSSVLGGANCWDALQALPDPEAALAEVARCLRPGAPFTCFTFREAPEPYGYFQHRLRGTPRTLFSEAWVLESASKAGLEVVDISGAEYALFFTLRRPDESS